jgi:hypothetical protein
MKFLLLLSLVVSALLTSCKSEYEERLSEAKELQERYLIVEETNMLYPQDELVQELDAIEEKIDYLARLSGNEYMFFKELNMEQDQE